MVPPLCLTSLAAHICLQPSMVTAGLVRLAPAPARRRARAWIAPRAACRPAASSRTARKPASRVTLPNDLPMPLQGTTDDLALSLIHDLSSCSACDCITAK